MVTTIETKLFINGKFVPSSDGKKFPVTSPFTNKVVAEVYEASEEDTNAAVAAAKEAFPAWSSLSPVERGKPLARVADLIDQLHDEFAELEALSVGRPVSGYIDSKAASRQFRHYSEAGFSLGTSSLNTPGFVNLTYRQPFGVAAAIIPWNVPMLFLAKKLAPALITGNTMVLKSSEKAPLTSLKFASLINEAGFPPGVINIVSGYGAKSGSILSSHMDVRVLSFTGSTRTGRIIHSAAASSNLKKVVSELGGKCPAIIFDDARIDEAVKGTEYSIQWNSGQTCMANSRIYVHKAIAEEFISKFTARFGSARLGDPLDPTVTHGPQADNIQHKTVQQYVDLGKESGRMILGKSEPNGNFISPVVFVDTAENERIMREEVFGPVVNINTFEDEEEVVAMANDTEFGLYAAVYTSDFDRALRLSKTLQAGSVAINCTSPTHAPDMPFGGYKGSGLGREGMTESLDNFLEIKSVIMKVADS